MKSLNKEQMLGLIAMAEATGNENLLHGVKVLVHEVKVWRFKQTKRGKAK